MSKIKTAFHLLKEDPANIMLSLGRNGLLNWIPDRLYLKMVFPMETGYPLNLKHPKTYNEKLQWLKLYDRDPRHHLLADKYEVRAIIEKLIGKDYLPELYGIYDTPEQVEWDKLPKKFVLKSTNGSGGDTVLICRDRDCLDKEKTLLEMKQWIRRDPFCAGREWCYKGIKPRILCEELLENGHDELPPDDYKFMCFNGEPKLIQFHHDRFGDHTLNYYQPDWTPAPIKRVDEAKAATVAPRPEHLEQMLQIAKTLSADLLYARVDLYDTPKGVKFGEITLYPTAGFSTFENKQDELLLGSWLHLPCDERS